MRLLVFFTMLTGFTLPASAQSLDSMTLASDLGSVLASEEACGLSFDQAAIAAFIDGKVSADDMNFAPTLSMMIQGHEFQMREMSASGRTAHCTQIARVAKSYGFTK